MVMENVDARVFLGAGIAFPRRALREVGGEGNEKSYPNLESRPREAAISYFASVAIFGNRCSARETAAANGPDVLEPCPYYRNSGETRRVTRRGFRAGEKPKCPNIGANNSPALTASRIQSVRPCDRGRVRGRRVYARLCSRSVRFASSLPPRR